MKRVYSYIFILMFVFIPLNVFAYELNCEGDKHYNKDSFICTISTQSTDTLYSSIKGTLTIPEELACEANSIDPGLQFVKQNDKSFELAGNIKNGFIIKYKCTVLKDVQYVTIKQILVSDFSYMIEAGSGDPYTEVLRSNTINLVPEAEKTRAQVDTKPRDTSNPNSLLKAITLDGTNFVFSKFLTSYDLEVLYEVETAKINTIVNVEGASVTIEGNTNLSVGENTIDIKVVSPDGTSTTYYTLNITRHARGEKIYNKEADSSLKTLELEGYKIQFDPDVFDYTVELPYDVQNIILNTKANSENAKVINDIPDKLVNGSRIVVTVKSADGTEESKYIINIKKVAPKKDFTLPLILAGAGVLILLLIYLFIKHHQKKEKKDPLLKLKHDKRGLNKGQNFNDGAVPVADHTELVEDIDTLDGLDNQQPGVINSANVDMAAMPIQVTNEQQPDTNLNKTTSVVSTIDLTASEKAAPIAVQAQPVQQQVVAQPQSVQVQPQVVQTVQPQQVVVQPQPTQTVNPVQPIQPQPLPNVQQVVMQQPQPQVVPQNVQVIQVGTQNVQNNQNNQ